MTKNILQNFGENFIKGGITIGLALTLIDFISKYNNAIYYYAFASASFFLVQIFQFDRVNQTAPKLTLGFTKHTLVGGIFYVFNALLMYILYLNKVSNTKIIISCVVLSIIGLLAYTRILYK